MADRGKVIQNKSRGRSTQEIQERSHKLTRTERNKQTLILQEGQVKPTRAGQKIPAERTGHGGGQHQQITFQKNQAENKIYKLKSMKKKQPPTPETMATFL